MTVQLTTQDGNIYEGPLKFIDRTISEQEYDNCIQAILDALPEPRFNTEPEDIMNAIMGILDVKVIKI